MTQFGSVLSGRTFGIEIETGFDSEGGLHTAMGQSPWTFTRDGSLTCKNPIEVVSPILKNDKDIDTLREMCDILKHNGANPDHPTCSVHVHIGFKEAKQEVENLILSEEEYLALGREVVGAAFVPFRVIRLFYRGSNEADPLNTRDYELMQQRLQFTRSDRPYILTSKGGQKVVHYSKDNVTRYFSLSSEMLSEYEAVLMSDLDDADSSKKEANAYKKFDERILSHDKKLPGKYFVRVKKESAVEALKTAFYFYTMFSDVHRAMVQDSRKINNSYCMPLSESFDPAEIEKLKDAKEIQAYWYKCSPEQVSSRTSNHYDDSRYHEVNLHSIWNRHGTIEIRSMAGTIDWRKIALWAVLHQAIVDQCVDGRLTIDKIRGASGIVELRQKAEFMLSILELPTPVDMFVRRLINYFNKFKKPL